MIDKENLNPQPTDPKKPAPEQNPTTQPVQKKPDVPVGQPKGPHSEPEKHDQEKKQA